MQTEERIRELRSYIEKRKRIKLDQIEDPNTEDTIHFLDIGDLVRILYTLDWVLGDDNASFLGVDDV